MRRMRAFDFEVVTLSGPPRLVCRFLTKTNDSVTLFGNSIEDIFEQCRSKFPEGINASGIAFTANNPIDAKVNFCALLNMGLRSGYFKASDFNGSQIKNDEDEDVDNA